MKTNILKRNSAAILVLLFSLITILTSCAKNDSQPLEEDINATIPELSISVVKSGNKSTATITGKISDFWFDQIYYNEDGSLPGPKKPIRTRYEIKYDRVNIISNGTQPFEFKRVAPYTYEIMYVAENKNNTARITLEKRTQPGNVYYEVRKEY